MCEIYGANIKTDVRTLKDEKSHTCKNNKIKKLPLAISLDFFRSLPFVRGSNGRYADNQRYRGSREAKLPGFHSGVPPSALRNAPF